MGDSLKQQYQRLSPTLDRCIEEGRAVLATLLGPMAGSHLVRASIIEARQKSLSSLTKKAQRNGWKDDEVFERAGDLVGFRIVCSNLEDVFRIRDLILGSTRFRQTDDCVRDYIKAPQESGYRAVHLNLIYDVVGVDTTSVPCEIQIRTLAQDSWARLAHFDVYKQGDELPEHILKSSRRLASLLGLADDAAQDLREEVSKPLASVEPEDGEIDPQALSFLYRKSFGEDAPDYVVTLGIQNCERVSCYRLDLLDRMVGDKTLRSEINEAYVEHTNWDISDEDYFLLCPEAAVAGREVAIARARELGKEQWEEIEAVAEREIDFDLPDRADDFIEFFHDSEFGVDSSLLYQTARRWKALGECAVCGAPIIKVDEFVDAVVDHYGIDYDAVGTIGEWLVNCGIETGDFDKPSLCSYHGYVMSKDD